MAKKHWIAGAIKHPGALRQELHVPEGKKIPEAKLEKAAHAGGKLGQRARLAQTLKSMPHHNSTSDHEKTFYSPKIMFAEHCPRKISK